MDIDKQNFKIECRLDAYTRSDGSAILSQGIHIVYTVIMFNMMEMSFSIFSPKIFYSKNCTGETATTATISGPGEVKLHNLQIDKSHVEVSYRSKSGVPNITDKLREKILRETCESAISSVLYPRSSIFLQIHEIENTCGVRNYQLKVI